MNTPTPTTNAKWERLCCSGQSWYQIAEEMKLDCRQLESELTAAREDLKAVTIERDEFHVKIEELAIKLQAVTEQRDKLAELSGFGEFDKPWAVIANTAGTTDAFAMTRNEWTKPWASCYHTKKSV